MLRISVTIRAPSHLRLQRLISSSRVLPVTAKKKTAISTAVTRRDNLPVSSSGSRPNRRNQRFAFRISFRAFFVSASSICACPSFCGASADASTAGVSSDAGRASLP